MKRSSDILNGAEWANVRALYKSSGFTDDELKNPIIPASGCFGFGQDYSGSQCI